MATGTPIDRPSAFVSLTDINNQVSFFLEGRYQQCCAHCGRIKGSWQVHHVIFRQHCRKEGAPQYSPDNALRVCQGAAECCHEREHSAQERIRVSDLRDENIAFAARWLGPGPAYEYLRRRYEDDGDPRLDALLEQP
jgi:hypothetical protein